MYIHLCRQMQKLCLGKRKFLEQLLSCLVHFLQRFAQFVCVCERCLQLPRLRHDSIICVTWRVCMCDMPRHLPCSALPSWRACVKAASLICDMTH